MECPSCLCDGNMADMTVSDAVGRKALEVRVLPEAPYTAWVPAEGDSQPMVREYRPERDWQPFRVPLKVGGQVLTLRTEVRVLDPEPHPCSSVDQSASLRRWKSGVRIALGVPRSVRSVP